MLEVNVYYWRENEEREYTVWVRDAKTDELVSELTSYYGFGDITRTLNRSVASGSIDVVNFLCSYHPKQIDQVKLKEYETGKRSLNPLLVNSEVCATLQPPPIAYAITGDDGGGVYNTDMELIATMQKENQRLTGECLGLREANDELTRKLTARNGRIGELTGVVSGLNKSLLDRNNQIYSLNDEASQRVAEIARLNKELSEYKIANDMLGKASQRDFCERHELQKRLMFSNNELANLKTRVAKAIG